MRPSEDKCTCPHGVSSVGARFNGINMGKSRVRLSTTPNCPVHDSCHGYTKAVRAERAIKEPWGPLWCPKHKTGNCPS